MKHTILALVLLGMLLSCSACRLDALEPEELRLFLDDVASDLGSTQITDDQDLIGQRTRGTDTYTGSYTASCSDQTGRDMTFGGASTRDRVLRCWGTVTAQSGTAAIRIRLNEDVVILEPDEHGRFDTQLHLKSGGNYIMVDYTDFVGTVELHCGYTDE